MTKVISTGNPYHICVAVADHHRNWLLLRANLLIPDINHSCLKQISRPLRLCLK
jgi:hypothetical protein